MIRFTIHWLDGHTSSVEGVDITDACNKAGIGAGAIPAMDYYVKDDTKEIEEKEE